MGDETCDDGNTLGFDGCDDECNEEAGWNCTSDVPTTCEVTCGDGLVRGLEECDDENAIDDDGCTGCLVDLGWSCTTGQPTRCSAICGDGRVVGDEECDDGNTTNRDGCSGECRSDCIVDQFDSGTLNARWNPSAFGSSPSFSLQNSWLEITDAALQPTVADPSISWLNDLNVDRGNQMSFPVTIGAGDFDVGFVMEAESSLEELTYAGVILTDESNIIQVFCGLIDAWESQTGRSLCILRQGGGFDLDLTGLVHLTRV